MVDLWSRRLVCGVHWNLLFLSLHLSDYVAYGSDEACSTCLSDRVKLTVDRVCSSSVTVVESALCFEFSFFHLPVVSGSSLYCHGHFGRRKSLFCFCF